MMSSPLIAPKCTSSTVKCSVPDFVWDIQISYQPQQVLYDVQAYLSLAPDYFDSIASLLKSGARSKMVKDDETVIQYVMEEDNPPNVLLMGQGVQ